MRLPWGDLVFTAFSGSHQDAIKKGFAAQNPDGEWNVPYLPIDPTDLGRSYDSVIRINSQSGKGGIAHLLETHYGLVFPRRLQVEFSGVVQQHTDSQGGEVSAVALWQLFSHTYLETISPLKYIEHQLFRQDTVQGITLEVAINGSVQHLNGQGNGPIDAAVNALSTMGIHVNVRSYEERAIGQNANGSEANACAFIELSRTDYNDQNYGVGIDSNIVTAAIKAVISAINRLMVN